MLVTKQIKQRDGVRSDQSEYFLVLPVAFDVEIPGVFFLVEFEASFAESDFSFVDHFWIAAEEDLALFGGEMCADDAFVGAVFDYA